MTVAVHGRNVVTMVTKDKDGHKLCIEVDLDAKGAPSASGKSTVIGSTQGNVTVVDANGRAVSVGVNVYVR